MDQKVQLDHLRKSSQDKPLSRRDFISALSIASAAGPGLIAATLSGVTLTRSQRAEAAESMVAAIGKLPRRKMGTKMGNMKLTPICICSDWNPELIAPALSLGINYIHKAGYWGDNVPDVVKALPRESYYTDITVDNTPDHPADYDTAYNQVINSLDKNGLKYYDIYRAHFGWKTLDAFKTQDASYKAFQRLKREGKVRYFGVSQHPYVPYPEIIQAEIDSGIIDAMQVWFTYGTHPPTQAIFAAASKAGIGMTAMKIYSNGHINMQNNPDLMQQMKAPGLLGRSLIRYVLAQKRPDHRPIFDTCVTALGNMQVFEENIGAVSHQIAMKDGYLPNQEWMA